jgi:hypothetical protein
LYVDFAAPGSSEEEKKTLTIPMLTGVTGVIDVDNGMCLAATMEI